MMRQKKLPGVDGRGLGWQRWDPSHSNPTPIPPGPVVQNCQKERSWYCSLELGWNRNSIQTKTKELFGGKKTAPLIWHIRIRLETQEKTLLAMPTKCKLTFRPKFPNQLWEKTKFLWMLHIVTISLSKCTTYWSGTWGVCKVCSSFFAQMHFLGRVLEVGGGMQGMQLITILCPSAPIPGSWVVCKVCTVCHSLPQYISLAECWRLESMQLFTILCPSTSIPGSWVVCKVCCWRHGKIYKAWENCCQGGQLTEIDLQLTCIQNTAFLNFISQSVIVSR